MSKKDTSVQPIFVISRANTDSDSLCDLNGSTTRDRYAVIADTCSGRSLVSFPFWENIDMSPSRSKIHTKGN